MPASSLSRQLPAVDGGIRPPLDVVAPPDPAQAETKVHISPRLSTREIEVLRTWLLAESKSDVARRLYLSIGTVNTHLSRIRAKYDVVGRPANDKAILLARALQDGLISLDEFDR